MMFDKGGITHFGEDYNNDSLTNGRYSPSCIYSS